MRTTFEGELRNSSVTMTITKKKSSCEEAYRKKITIIIHHALFIGTKFENKP